MLYCGLFSCPGQDEILSCLLTITNPWEPPCQSCLNRSSWYRCCLIAPTLVSITAAAAPPSYRTFSAAPHDCAVLVLGFFNLYSNTVILYVTGLPSFFSDRISIFLIPGIFFSLSSQVSLLATLVTDISNNSCLFCNSASLMHLFSEESKKGYTRPQWQFHYPCVLSFTVVAKSRWLGKNRIDQALSFTALQYFPGLQQIINNSWWLSI